MSIKAARSVLNDAIERERAAIDRIVTLLQAEQAELTQARSDKLEALIQSKTRELRALGEFRQQRLDAFAAAGIPRDAFKAALAFATNEQLSTSWDKLQRSAHEASLLNALNAQLVRIKLQHVSARLEALHGAAGHRQLYAADGRTDASGTGRVIAAA